MEFLKYYVYALDLRSDCITAAVSCPDKKTAKQAFLIASRKMKPESNMRDFHFRYIGVVPQEDSDGLDWLGTGVEIQYVKGELIKKTFNTDDFVFAETQTEECLNDSQNCLDIEFMREVKLAISSLTASESEDGQEDVVDRLARIKGRWVTQEEFLNENINKKPPAIRSLRTQRTEKNVEMSKKNPSIGIDKAGYFFEKTTTSDKKTASNTSYRYFLRREFDKQNESDLK